jgi:hypothetical protein
VRRSGVIVGFISGWLFFKEKNILAKSVDLLLVLIAMVLLWLGTTAKAQAQEVSNFYSNMPRSLQTWVNPEMKPDTLTDEYVRFQVSEVSRCELLVETAGTDTVLLYIHTAAGPAEDSHLACYTTQWKLLPTAPYFTEPTWRNFVRPDATSEGVEAVRVGLFPALIAYQYDALRRELVASIQPETYLPKEQWERIRPYLRTEPLRYRWSDGRFVPSFE